MVVVRCKENLCLVLESSVRFAVKDSRVVPVEFRTDGISSFVKRSLACDAAFPLRVVLVDSLRKKNVFHGFIISIRRLINNVDSMYA